MNHKDQVNLKALIDSEPLNDTRTDQEIFDWLQEQVGTESKGERQTFKTIIAELGPIVGHQIRGAIQNAGQSDSDLAAMYLMLNDGVDLSHPSAVEAIDAAVPAVLTQAQADALKGAGLQVVDRMKQKSLNGVTLQHVINRNEHTKTRNDLKYWNIDEHGPAPDGSIGWSISEQGPIPEE
jgi:hypothetical protein